MAQTVISYRGKRTVTLGQFGTLMIYIFMFIFGCGWLSIGVLFCYEGNFIAIFPFLVGFIIVFISGWTIYDNQKDIIEDRRYKKAMKKIDDLLIIKKTQYKPSTIGVHPLLDGSKTDDYLMDEYAWNTLQEILLVTKYYERDQITLARIVYDGLGIDSYYFDLYNNFITDKFIRGQKVVLIDDEEDIPVNSILTIRYKSKVPTVSGYELEEYSCYQEDTDKYIFVYSSQIMDYEEWKNLSN